MTLRDPESPLPRMVIAIVGALGIMLAAGLIYVLLVAKEPGAKFNGAAIVAAAHAYTKDLRARNQPIPPNVALEQLVALNFLKPEEAAAFRSLNATVVLTTQDRGPQAVLMRVQFPDGMKIELLGDGTVRELPK